MMPDLGKYAGDVLAAYGLTLLLLGGLVLVTWLRARAVRQTLDQAEARRADG